VLEEQCFDDRSAEYHECLDRTDYSWSTCDHVLDDQSCDFECDDTSECVERGYEFEHGDSDPELLHACERFWAHNAQCGLGATSLCGTWSRTEKPEMREVYDCLAEQPCGERADCLDDVEPIGLPEFCPALERECDATCTEEFAAFLEEEDVWLRLDVARSLADCLDEPDCDDVIACTNAWIDVMTTPVFEDDDRPDDESDDDEPTRGLSEILDK
jgi:hypothetical protein